MIEQEIEYGLFHDFQQRGHSCSCQYAYVSFLQDFLNFSYLSRLKALEKELVLILGPRFPHTFGERRGRHASLKTIVCSLTIENTRNPK
jgi:hypothetical protein